MKGCKSWWCNYQYNLKGYIILIFPEAISRKYQRWKTKNMAIIALESMHILNIERNVNCNYSISHTHWIDPLEIKLLSLQDL